jgi:hypothetical protein
MHVGVHVAGNDPLSGGIDDDVVGSGAKVERASDGGDAASLDRDVGIRERRSAGSVE